MPFRRASASAAANYSSNSTNSPATFAAAAAAASASPSSSSTSQEREQLQFQRLISFDQARRSFIHDPNNVQSNTSNLNVPSSSNQRRHSTPAAVAQPDGFGGFSPPLHPTNSSLPTSPFSDSAALDGTNVMAKIGKKDKKDRRRPSMSIGDDLPICPHRLPLQPSSYLHQPATQFIYLWQLDP